MGNFIVNPMFMISEKQGHEMADSWLRAWNSHDIKQIMAHYADTIEFTSPFVTALLNKPDGKIKGKSVLEAYFLQGLAKYPELNFKLLHVLPGVASLTLVYISVHDLVAAEVMEVNAEGKVINVLAHYGANGLSRPQN